MGVADVNKLQLHSLLIACLQVITGLLIWLTAVLMAAESEAVPLTIMLALGTGAGALGATVWHWLELGEVED